MKFTPARLVEMPAAMPPPCRHHAAASSRRPRTRHQEGALRCWIWFSRRRRREHNTAAGGALRSWDTRLACGCPPQAARFDSSRRPSGEGGGQSRRQMCNVPEMPRHAFLRRQPAIRRQECHVVRQRHATPEVIFTPP